MDSNFKLLLAIHACHRGVIDWDKVAEEMGGGQSSSCTTPDIQSQCNYLTISTEFTANAIRCHMHLLSSKSKKDGDGATKNGTKAGKTTPKAGKTGKARTPADPLAPTKSPKSRVQKRSGETKKGKTGSKKKDADSSPSKSADNNPASADDSADQNSDEPVPLKFEEPSDI